ncbi:MAG: SOS response-associated peptidase [Planctomycetes bacterium]|nr:SOS response-associated peptidase [Planctomycetota bacterium]
MPSPASGSAGEQTRWESCTIITTSANNTMRPLHDRMPVILSPRGLADVARSRSSRSREVRSPAQAGPG